VQIKYFEDQLAAEKKCGHMGGKVLIPTQNAIRNLKAARLASRVMNVPLVILARTDANAAKLITSDCDENDKPFLTGERSSEGFYYVKDGIEQAISRGLAYAPYCDLIWCETAKPDLNEAKIFADAIHKKYPGKLLAYNCYKFQFITLAGFHVQNYSVFKFAQSYKKDGMAAYSKIQQQEFEAEKEGYTAVKHQREVGTTYFDTIAQIISSGKTSTTAMSGSTESEQF